MDCFLHIDHKCFFFPLCSFSLFLSCLAEFKPGQNLPVWQRRQSGVQRTRVRFSALCCDPCVCPPSLLQEKSWIFFFFCWSTKFNQWKEERWKFLASTHFGLHFFFLSFVLKTVQAGGVIMASIYCVFFRLHTARIAELASAGGRKGVFWNCTLYFVTLTNTFYWEKKKIIVALTLYTLYQCL